MVIEKIKKRSGEIVDYDGSKISNAIRKANMESTDINFDSNILEDLTNQVKSYLLCNGDDVPTVENIQDVVEKILIKNNYASTAKAYILYRAERTKVREGQNVLMEIFNTLTFSDAADADIKRENGNIDGNTAMGTMLKYGSEGAKFYIDNYILPKDIAYAHVDGSIHIHDKDFYMLTETCCQIDLLKLFHNGFSTGHGFLREPNCIRSYAALACIAIQANQNEMHGGQAIPHFDYCMAPGVAKSFKKHFKKYLVLLFSNATYNRANKDNVSSLENFIEKEISNTKIPKFEYVDRLISFFFHNTNILVLDREKAYNLAIEETKNDTYQAMEAFIHNLNTMHSRAGAQVPFSSINYGTDTSLEGRIVTKALLDATWSGLGDGETPIFPVQIFKVKEGVNYNKEDPNYDLFKLAIKVSAKRLFPNFSFLDSPFNIQYYKPNDYNSEVAYMGCRTRVMGNVYDKDKEITCGRGNLSFTSINLPRLAIKVMNEGTSKIDKFFTELDSIIDLTIRQLLHRFKIQSAKKVYNYPFLMGQGVWLDSDKLKPNDTVGEVLKHGTLSIGFIGLAETLTCLTGKHHGESEESQKLGLRIVSHMRKRMDDMSKESGLNFTLLATPAEGLSGRFVRIDRKKYGVIEGVTDKEYYTNSFHITPRYDILAAKKIKLEAPYHELCNAGHITYVEMDGDPLKNLNAFERIIRCMKESGIGYGSVNHPVDRDPVCGYTGIINNVCPKCGRAIFTNGRKTIKFICD